MPVSLVFAVTCREGESVDLLLHAELGLPESGEASLKIFSLGQGPVGYKLNTQGPIWPYLL